MKAWTEMTEEEQQAAGRAGCAVSLMPPPASPAAPNVPGLLAYIDDAKRALGDERISGEPLADTIRRLLGDLESARAAADAADGLRRDIGDLRLALDAVPPGGASGDAPERIVRLHRAACEVAGIGVRGNEEKFAAGVGLNEAIRAASGRCLKTECPGILEPDLMRQARRCSGCDFLWSAEFVAKCAAAAPMPAAAPQIIASAWPLGVGEVVRGSVVDSEAPRPPWQAVDQLAALRDGLARLHEDAKRWLTESDDRPNLRAVAVRIGQLLGAGLEHTVRRAESLRDAGLTLEPLHPHDATCSACGSDLMFSARQRGNGLCGPCHRKTTGTQGLVDRCRDAGIEPALVQELVLEILAGPEGRAAIAECMRRPPVRQPDGMWREPTPGAAAKPGDVVRCPATGRGGTVYRLDGENLWLYAESGGYETMRTADVEVTVPAEAVPDVEVTVPAEAVPVTRYPLAKPRQGTSP